MMNTNLDKLFDKVDEKTASAFADVLLPVRPDAKEKKKVESRVLSAAGGKKRRALRPWHAVIAACLVVAVTLGAVFAPSIFGNGRQRVIEGGNFYNADGKTFLMAGGGGLIYEFSESLDDLLNYCHQADGSIKTNRAIFKAKLAGGSYNIVWYLLSNIYNSSVMLTPMEVVEVFESGTDAALKVGDIVYVMEPFVFVDDKISTAIEGKSGYGNCKNGDYLSCGVSNSTLIKPEHEYILFGMKRLLSEYLTDGVGANMTVDSSDVPSEIVYYYSYGYDLIFDTTERLENNYTEAFASCYDEVIAKYCG